MKFLVDVNLPIGLAVRIRSRGHDAVHVSDVVGCHATDREIRHYAVQSDAIVITKDQDFVTPTTSHAPAVVWLRLGNATNAALKIWMEARWDAIIAQLATGELLIEVV